MDLMEFKFIGMSRRRGKSFFQDIRNQFDFSKIKRVDFLIWDATNSEYLHWLRRLGSVGILQTRSGKLNFGYRTILKTSWNILKGMRGWEAYFAACIEQLGPCAVFTHIDNDRRFHNVAGNFPGVQFVAIQNGWRWPCFGDESQAFPAQEFMTTMLCFSQFDVDSWHEHGTNFAQIMSVGSLRNAHYALQKATFIRDEEKNFADLCVLSQYRQSINELDYEIWLEHRRMLHRVGSFLKAHPSITAIVALTSKENDLNLSDEIEFFSQYLPANVLYRARCVTTMSSYTLADACQVTVSSASTLGIETLGRGNRTLMAGSLISDTVQNSPFKNAIWVTDLDSQCKFDGALTKLLEMDDQTFRATTLKSVHYFCGPMGGNDTVATVIEIAKLALNQRNDRVLA